MNGLRKQQVSKTSGFRNSLWFLFGFFLVMAILSFLGVGHAQQQDSPPERMDAHTVLFTFEGKQYMGFDLEASKALKKAETDAKAFKAELDLCHDNLQKAKDNTQDERVRAANIKRDYDDQSKLLTSCMVLSKNGSGIMNKYLRFGLDVAPTVVTLVKPCN